MTGLDLSTTRREARTSPLDILLVVAAAIALLLGVLDWRHLLRQLGRLEHDEAQATAQVRQLEDKVRALEGTLDAARGTGDRAAPGAPPSSVVRAIADLLPEDARLLDLSLAYDARTVVEVHIAARKASAYDQFLERVHGSASFRSIAPGPEVRDRDVTGSLRAEYGASSR